MTVSRLKRFVFIDTKQNVSKKQVFIFGSIIASGCLSGAFLIALYIEYIHLYLSHFNLLLFSIIMFKKKFIIQKKDLYKSIILNASIFFTIIWINNLIGSNYWFTLEKPPGTNLTNILPDWPGYLIVMVAIGILSYIMTYRMFKLNRK